MRLPHLTLVASLLVVIEAPMLPALPASAQMSLSIEVPPPPLPVYVQPPIPEPGYLWAPGY